MEQPRRKTPSRPAEVEAWLTGLSERIVAGHALEDGARERRGRRRFLLGLAGAGAAAATLLGWWLARRAPPDARRSIDLGPDGIRPLRPLGEARSFEVFEWEGLPPPGGATELRIGARGSEAVLRKAWPTEPRWRLSPEEARGLPDDLWWEVRLLDALGNPVAVRRWEAARAQP